MQGASILVVDDSPTILKLVELTLAKAGFRVSTADCGELGIRPQPSIPLTCCCSTTFCPI